LTGVSSSIPLREWWLKVAILLLLRQMSQKPAKKSGVGCSRSESFLQKEDVVLLVYWLKRLESTLISEVLTTTME
jgi:hypothetical protein